MKYVESGENYIHSVGYEYDEINNLTALVETINGVERQTSYTYDLDNRVTGITTGDSGRSYSYDALGRISQWVTKQCVQIRMQHAGFWWQIFIQMPWGPKYMVPLGIIGTIIQIEILIHTYGIYKEIK